MDAIDTDKRKRLTLLIIGGVVLLQVLITIITVLVKN